jgi:hypothetical protein
VATASKAQLIHTHTILSNTPSDSMLQKRRNFWLRLPVSFFSFSAHNGKEHDILWTSLTLRLCPRVGHGRDGVIAAAQGAARKKVGTLVAAKGKGSHIFHIVRDVIVKVGHGTDRASVARIDIEGFQGWFGRALDKNGGSIHQVDNLGILVGIIELKRGNLAIKR